MILLSRLIAFLIDYLILGFYGLTLLGFVILMGLEEKISSPVIGQLVGFFTLTLPVVLYFTLLEHGSCQASVGKLAMRLKVTDESLRSASLITLSTRNLWKFLPWEIAHWGVHWAYYYGRQQVDPPIWIWGPLILSQLLAIGYVVSIVLNSHNRALYEQWSGTQVIYADRR